MPYTNESDYKLTSFVSSRTGWTSWFGNSYVKVSSLDRSGQNGIFTKDGRTFMFLKIPRKKRYVVEVQDYFQLKRVVISHRKIGGRPIYKLVKTSRRGLPTTKVSVLVGYTKARMKPIYGYIKIPRRRKIWSTKIVYRSKRISIPPVLLPDITPHSLSYSSITTTGHETPSVITLHNNANPGDVVVTNNLGCMSGSHCGVGSWGVNVGFLNHSNDYAIVDELRYSSLYKLSNSARNGIANLSNMAVEYQGLKSTVGTYLLDGLKLMLRGKKAVQKAIIEGLSDSKKLASGYLGFVYGLTPLISDVNKIINEMNEKGRTWRRYNGRAKKKWSSVTSGSNEFSSWTIERTFELTIKNQVMVTGTTSHPVIANHASTNNLAAGWEFTPWSFVVDWAIPISTWLESHDLFSGVSVKNWHESKLYIETYKYTLTHRTEYSNWSCDEQTQVFTGRYVTFSRTILGGSPVLPLPRFKNPLSLTHMSNAIVLLISLLKR